MTEQSVTRYQTLTWATELAKQMWREIFAHLESGEYTPAIFASLPGIDNVGEALNLVMRCSFGVTRQRDWGFWVSYSYYHGILGN